MRNAAILLGAGASIPAGFPSTCCITKQVLSGNGAYRHTDATYSFRQEGTSQPPDRSAALTTNLVRYYHSEAERYYSVRSGRPSNYEDLFYLAHQIHSEVFGEAENPALRAFAHQLKSEVMPLLDRSELSWSYPELLTETKNYITDTVRRCLSKNGARDEHLKAIHRPCALGRIATIATLCHDTHVERHLLEHCIPLNDGFSEEQAGVRYWTGDFSDADRVSFLKLHGSVDWFQLRPDESKDWYEDKIGIPLDGDPDHTKRPDGTPQISLDNGRRMLLIGTFNKLSDYGIGIFGDLHYRFRSSIRSCSRLVVCGYSFGDRGINSEIIEWMYAEDERKLVVIHPHQEELVDGARGAIRNKWENWENWKKSIIVIPKRVECVERDELLQYI